MVTLFQLVRGAALGSVVAGVLWAVALLAGMVTGANRIILVALAVFGFAYPAISARGRGAAAAGAGGVAALGAVSGAVTGFGWLEGVLVVGGILAAAWLWDGRERVPPVRTDVLAFVVVVVVVVALVPLIMDGGTLGHDEAAYALKARSWLEGTPDSGWSIHRAPALSAIEYVVLSFGGGETAMRMSGLLALAGLTAATWWLGTRMFDRTVGAIAAVVVVAGPSMLRRATEALTDIPAAAFLMASMAIVWIDFARRRGPTYQLLWVIPLAWAAFYLRYQAVLAFGLIAVAMLIAWWPRIKARPAPVVVSAVVGAIGLVPHAMYATAELGSPIAILQATGEVAGREYFGEGIVDYAMLLGWPIAGLLGLPLVVFFLWWLARSWSQPGRSQAAIFLAVPAIGQVLALGVLSHGEPRFVFFPLALVAIGAVAGAIEVTAGWSPSYRAGARVALVALLVSSLGISVANTRSSVENRALTYEPIELASDFVEEAAGPDCAVMTSYLPQVTYYSLCFTDGFSTGLDPEEAISDLEGEGRFMILIEGGKRQPTGKNLKELIDETEGQPVPIAGERDHATVYEFED